MTREVIIQYIPQEIRVATRENGRLSDLAIERPSFRNPVGNIYKARVFKVLPGMESAFVDIGMHKAAFLYVDDARLLSSIDPYWAKEKDKQKTKKKLPEVQFDIPNGDNATNRLQPSSAAEAKDAAGSKLRINDLVHEGQEVIVQVFKAPISKKGARVSCNLSIPGRNLVLLPFSKGLSFSKQITSDTERKRIRSMIPEQFLQNFGLIVRTVGADSSAADFKNEVQFLQEIWMQVTERYKRYSAPCLLFEEPNVIDRLMRDSLGPKIERVVIDDKGQYEKMLNFVRKFLPAYESKLVLYNERMGIFDYYDVTSELNLAMGRKVLLPSGGHLVIDQSEALTAIDVNTGKFIGDASHDDTILQTNLEAVVEIVHQVKLRDIGGIIVIDFIDMSTNEQRQKVHSALKRELKYDRTKSRITSVSELGLIEMTRQRSQDNLNKLVSETCPYCEGSGLVSSAETIFFNICRDLYNYKRHRQLPKKLGVYVHPDVVDYIEFVNKEAFEALKKNLQASVYFKSDPVFHPAQYRFSDTLT